MNIIISSTDSDKTNQIKAILKDLPLAVFIHKESAWGGSMHDGEAMREGVTLAGNAFKKARFAQECVPKIWAMADDSGIFINALGGRPGKAHPHQNGMTATTDDIVLYTLHKMNRALDRSALFQTVVALVSPEGKEYTFVGNLLGRLMAAPRCCHSRSKMPYDSLFMPDGSNKVLGQMTVEEEGLFSHRDKAFRQVRAFLASVLR